MSYDESDAAMDDFYDRMSQEFYPEHKEQAIQEFIEERMQSYFLKNPLIIQAPLDCYHHAKVLADVSPQGALVMYTAAIELFLKSVLLKPVLYGMIHNENIANTIVDATTAQSGFSRYKKLLNTLCLHAAEFDLNDIKGAEGKPILEESADIQMIRNRVVHQGYKATSDEAQRAKDIAEVIVKEVINPVLRYLDLKFDRRENGFEIVKG